jgi:hypothetical protein
VKTLLATVSIGNRYRLTRHSLPRMETWARTCGMDFVVIRQPLTPPELPPHFNKLAVPAAFPGYDRYVIVDDDLLISRHAPTPPAVARGAIGLVPDDEQRHTRAPYVKWTGNTGFIIADAAAAPVFADALARGSDETIWGYADQSALNRSAWQAGCIEKLDARWNFMPVINYFVTRDTWEKWRTSRLYRLAYYLGITIGLARENRRKITTAYGVHLVRAPYPGLFSRLMG